MTRIVFMGTPDFAVPSLAALLRAGYPVAGVITQPDRPAGRGRKLDTTPVKQYAAQQGLTLLQPERLRTAEATAALAELQPELIVVTAYGQILREPVLALPRYGCINVHASLLPRWRGAAPVQAALLAGDEVTGCTIMQMNAGMDTGPLLAQAALRVEPEDTGGSLATRLAELGAALLVDTLPRWLTGELSPQPQDETLATLCRPLQKQQGLIDWTRPAPEIARAVRAFNPWPGASTTWQGQPLKILHALALPAAAMQPPGHVLLHEGAVAVTTGAGLLLLETLQLAGRGITRATDFARGQRTFVGSILG